MTIAGHIRRCVGWAASFLCLRCFVVCLRELKNTMLLRMRGKQASQAFIYILFGVCLFGLFSLRRVEPDCSAVAVPQVSKSEYEEEDDLLKPSVPNGTVFTQTVSSSIFEKTYPYGTKHNDSNPVIFITSLTEVQPGQKEWFILGESEFQNCPNLESYMRCHYITKPSALNFSSAVLLHSRFLDEITVPTTRKSGQKWIFFESEPPPETWKRANLTKYRDIFNITSTYSMDSDIPLTYHKSVCVPNLSYQVPTHNLAATKSKHVAWFVSSCSTHSRREEYVRELQKYIGVDIFGKCGDEKCYNVEDGESCIRDVINSTYKFYLSFENSLCREYHTEKLSRIFSLNTIPIVLGLADYANILPRGAYIDVRDYPSPKAMADYLHEIDQNDDLFNQYIIRKNSHWCHLPDSITFACSVCRYLHEHRYERKSVHDIARFWGNEERCMSPDLFYKGIADDVLVHL